MSGSKHDVPQIQYLGPNNLPEAARLKAQSDLVVGALQGLVLAPVDLSRHNLQVLDSGTADALFLRQLRDLLAHPESATLVGTDISPYNGNEELSSHIEWYKQDVNLPWPEEWRDRFDFVHQRAVLSVTGNVERAKSAVNGLVDVLNPGGWIQLVDGYMPMTAIESDNKASTRLQKVLGLSAKAAGLDVSLGQRAQELLMGNSRLDGVEGRSGVSRIGKGARSEVLADAGMLWIEGFRNTLGYALDRLGEKAPIQARELPDLLDAVMREAETEGFDLTWWAAWARKKP